MIPNHFADARPLLGLHLLIEMENTEVVSAMRKGTKLEEEKNGASQHMTYHVSDFVRHLAISRYAAAYTKVDAWRCECV